jgi:hypothetical protein
MTTLDNQNIKFKGTHINNKKLKIFLNLLYMQFTIKDKFIQMPANDIKKILGGNYKNYLIYMIDNDIIRINNSYRTGDFTKRYKINQDRISEINLLLNTLTETEIITPGLNKYYEYVINCTKKITINYADAINYVNKSKILNNTLESKELLMYSINSIRNNNFFAKVDSRGRLYTNIVNLKREVRREHLRLDGEKLKEVDITNSQCYFLHLWMKEMNIIDELFAEDVINGNIYVKIMNYFNLNKKEAKTKVYVFIFGKNYRIDNFFKTTYPNVCKFLKDRKKELSSYKEVSHILQKKEAEFMFNVITKILMEKNIEFTTIHDAVLVKEINYNKVNDIMNIELKKLLLF